MTTAPPSPVAERPRRPALPRTVGERLRWLVTDAWSLAMRDVIRIVREPAELIGTLAFPIISVLLFGYVFGSAMTVAGGGDYRSFLMPGLFAMAIAFGAANTAMLVVTDSSRGVTDRIRAMPVSRSAVLGGRVVADQLGAVLDIACLVLVALAIGWRATEGVGPALLAIVLLLWLRAALTWVGTWLGFVLRSPESAMRSFGLVMPVAMLSNAFVSPELLPSWLEPVASWNPLSATVAATRQLFGNPGIVEGSFVSDHALLLAVLWPAVLTAVFAPLALRRYARLSR